MDVAFVLHVFQAFALIGVLLFGLVYLGRTTIESTALGQNVAVHVVRVAEKYYLVGGGTAGVALLAELPPEEIEPFVEAQRAALQSQRETLLRPFSRWRKS